MATEPNDDMEYRAGLDTAHGGEILTEDERAEALALSLADTEIKQFIAGLKRMGQAMQKIGEAGGKQ